MFKRHKLVRVFPTSSAVHPTSTIAKLERRIKRHGFELIYQDYCENSRTPGLIGQIRGVTDRELKQVRISKKANPDPKDRAEILAHELHHLDDPTWDCGNRDVLGRGGENNV